MPDQDRTIPPPGTEAEDEVQAEELTTAELAELAGGASVKPEASFSDANPDSYTEYLNTNHPSGSGNQS